MPIQTIGTYMLVTVRNFIIGHKAIFGKAIIAFASILPDPDDSSKFECQYVNTPILKRIRDKFLGYLNFKQDLYQAAWTIVIDEMEHDPDHRAALEFIIEEIVESVIDGEWKPRDVGWPSGRMWKEPRTENEGNYGGFRGYKFKQLVNK